MHSRAFGECFCVPGVKLPEKNSKILVHNTYKKVPDIHMDSFLDYKVFSLESKIPVPRG